MPAGATRSSTRHAERHFGSLRGGLVLSLVDVFVLEPAVWRELNVASWVPVDHDPVPPAVLDFLAATGAVPIAMSRFGQEQLSAFDPLYVPHGVATDVYRPQPRAELRAAGGFPQDAFVVGIVAVNKGVPSRKSLAEMIEAFAVFRARHDDAVLYLHTEVEGQHQGTHLPSLLEELGVDEDAVLVVDQNRYLFNPFTPEELAATYSTLDVLLNASMGEGFGLTVLEAQACGVPAIVTDFTAMSEVCGAGWKVGYERHWTDQASWQARPRVEEIVESLEACYGSTRSRGGSSPPAPASTRSSTTPTACWRSTGCRRSTRSRCGCPAWRRRSGFRAASRGSCLSRRSSAPPAA